MAAAAGFAERRYRERPSPSTRTEQILWFYFGFAAWATDRELGWDWPDPVTWLADQAALLHSGGLGATPPSQ